eukprot:363069-Chlamydomonas_euryale.AAC.5
MINLGSWIRSAEAVSEADAAAARIWPGKAAGSVSGNSLTVWYTTLISAGLMRARVATLRRIGATGLRAPAAQRPPRLMLADA